jgi:hypothetical protein
MGWWSSVGYFGEQTYRDVKTSGNNVRGCIVQGRNVRGRIVPIPTTQTSAFLEKEPAAEFRCGNMTFCGHPFLCCFPCALIYADSLVLNLFSQVPARNLICVYFSKSRR